jgi:hypothetical protein
MDTAKQVQSRARETVWKPVWERVDSRVSIPVENDVANRVWNQTERVLWNHVRRWVSEQAREDCDGR